MSKKLKMISCLAISVLLIIGPGNGCVSDNTGFRQQPALVADAEKLPGLEVSAQMGVRIVTGSNVLWCATFQLAWNEACSLAGGKLQFRPPVDPMVAILNRKLVDASDLDQASYVALAGYVRDGIYQRIDRAMQEKFNGGAKPHLLPHPMPDMRPQDIVTYCYLFKELNFPAPFERAQTPLDFNGSKVESFGMGPYKPGHDPMAKEVSIFDYRGPDDFVIELRTKSLRDHLVLAKITPDSTLEATIAGVQARILKGSPHPAEPTDILAVPKMNFDITRHYTELLGNQLIATAPGMPDDAMIVAADQNVRFLMDEKGVQLRSEAQLSIGCSAEAVSELASHRLVFDKPFLLMLSREGSKSPYFAVWIGNTELLQEMK